MRRALKDLLLELREKERSLLAFNAQNLYHLEAAVLTADAIKIPMIIQFSERYLRFLDSKFGIDFLLQKFNNNLVYFHLDHCTDIAFIKYCIDVGFDSVMYDGSSFDVNTNILHSNEVIAHARVNNCIVEGELGKVAGVEDGFGNEGSSYAEIDEIEKYVDETGIDLMALGIGNAHGFYNDLEALNMDILREASNKLDPHQLYVLHGGTGLPDEVIKKAISYGVVKINVSSDLKKKTMKILEHYINENQLYNEISFHKLLMEELSGFYQSYINKYTK